MKLWGKKEVGKVKKLLHFEMFVVFLVAILLLTVPGNPAYAGWARLYGDSTAQEIHDSVQTPDGGYLLVGATKLGAPPYSGLMIKLDSSGQVVCARSYGSNNEVFNSIIPLPNGNYLVAGKTKYFDTDDCLIVEVDSSGNVLTVRTFRGAGWDTCDAVARTPDGNFILAGSSLFFSPWNQDALLLKVNPSYEIIWSKLYSNPPVGGSYGMEELYALVPTGESGAIAVGSTDHRPAHDPSDVLALRVDGNGNLLWNSVFNGFYQDDEVWDEAKDIIFLADGSVMLTGYAYMNTSYDLLLLQLDAGNGAPLFNATYGDASANEYGQSLVETPSGELVITGWVSDATGARALFTRLDANRNVTIANVLGPATNADEITANILDVASYFVSGYEQWLQRHFPGHPSFVPLLQFRITSGPSEGIKIEGFTLQASGTGNDQTDILAVRLFLDANSDGTVGQNDIELWRGNFSADNGTATISIPPRIIPPNASETYLVTYDFAQTIAFQGIQHMPRFARLQHENKSQPIPLSRYPLFPFALCLILAIFSTGNKRFHALFAFLLLLSTFWFLTSCGGGGGAVPVETRTYQATLTSITAKGAITNTNVSVTGTPISGPALSVQK